MIRYLIVGASIWVIATHAVPAIATQMPVGWSHDLSAGCAWVDKPWAQGVPIPLQISLADRRALAACWRTHGLMNYDQPIQLLTRWPDGR